MQKILIGAASLVALTSAANATVVELNAPGLDNGETLTTQIAGLTVSAVADGGGTANDFAIIIDTTDPTFDGDLAAPFDDPSTVGDELFSPGNILAVAEGDCSGGFCRVDDNATGGEITFEFDRDVVFNSLDVFDFRMEELKVTFFDALGAVIGAPITGPDFNTDTGNNITDNLFTTLDLKGTVLRTVKFEFRGSGGIGNFDVEEVPIPAALPLLLSGLAGLGFASRRRRKA